jgi:hypothetical protein
MAQDVGETHSPASDEQRVTARHAYTKRVRSKRETDCGASRGFSRVERACVRVARKDSRYRRLQPSKGGAQLLNGGVASAMKRRFRVKGNLRCERTT